MRFNRHGADQGARRYLITGGAGFIGSSLSDALVARGDEVTVLDDLSTGTRANVAHLEDSGLLRFVEGSTLDEELVGKLVESSDVVLHLASAVGVQLVVQRPLDTLLRNIRGNDIVMGAAARHERKLLFTSTSEIYGKNSSSSLDEDADSILGSPFKARWSYATAKAFGEALAHSFHRERDLDFNVVRLFNTVGPRQTGRYGMVLPRFVRQAMAGEDLTVYGNGTQTRCFTHVNDAVSAILLLLDAEAAGRVFNVGTSTEVAVVELARRVIEKCNSSSKVSLIPYSEAYEAGFEELGRRVPDTTALRELTGWEPLSTVDDAISDVIDYEQAASRRDEPARSLSLAS
jgi:UDP-glucose 4-epimerase